MMPLSCLKAVKRTTESNERPPMSPLYVDVATAGDRSGSMSSTGGGSQEGAVIYMEKQRENSSIIKPNFGYFVDFTSFDDETYNLFSGEASDITPEVLDNVNTGMIPCGKTRLYDTVFECLTAQISRINAIYNNLNKTTQKLVDNCPWLLACSFAIMTDGIDNVSNVNNVNNCKNLIKIYKEKYHGNALFIGANQNAEKTAKKFGINQDSSLQMGTDRRSSYNAASSIASAQIRAVSSGGSISQSVPTFTQLERDISSLGPLTFDSDDDSSYDNIIMSPMPPPLRRTHNHVSFTLS